MTFIGTTLSIILTFGTAQYLELKQQRADGRQTAMMVIHDMEISAKQFEQYAAMEEERDKMTQYVIENLDHIKDIRWDTLNAVLTYLMQPKNDCYKYDDSNERLFLSSQDVWKNINNATFIDVVQSFFYFRRHIYVAINTSELYLRPISTDEVYQYIQDRQVVEFDFADFLSTRFKQPDIRFFLDGSSQRQRDLNQYMTAMQEYAKRCKFMMEISDEELKKYIAQRKHTGRPIKAKQLVGEWQLRADRDVNEVISFSKDRSMTINTTQYLSHPYFIGRIKVTYEQTGTWELNGDSLIWILAPQKEIQIDKSDITYLSSKEKEAAQTIEEWEAQLNTYQQQSLEAEPKRIAQQASIDSKGKKIEICDINSESNDEDYTYLIRIEN